MNLKNSFLALSLFALPCVGYSQEFLPPNLAFKPVLSGNIVTIHIADGYYLYQNKISLTDQNKVVPFSFTNKPIIKNFPQQGPTKVFTKSTQLKINPKSKYNNLTIKIQGCSLQGLCYPPQQIRLK